MDWVKAIFKIATIVPMVVDLVEKLAGSKKGKDKQDAALEGVKDIVTGFELIYGKELMDEVAFQDLIRRFIDDYVAIKNFAEQFKKNKEDN